jgi:hypothetical protein
MEHKSEQKPERRRRSSRMVLRIPLLVNATDAPPQADWEPVETILVSEHGGMLRAKQFFQVGVTLDIRMRNKNLSAQAKVVWTSSKITSKGMELGFELIDQDGFWDIKFPPEH